MRFFSTTKPALLTEVRAALIEVDNLDRDGDHEAASAIERRLVLGVLAAAKAKRTNHRTMTDLLLAHLEYVERNNTPRGMA